MSARHCRYVPLGLLRAVPPGVHCTRRDLSPRPDFTRRVPVSSVQRTSVVPTRGVSRAQAKAAAEMQFRARVAEMGGTIVGTYVRTKVPVSVQCGMGHVNDVWPMRVLRGSGICLTCMHSGQRAAGEESFRKRVQALGGTVLGPYSRRGTPVLVRCAAGHETRPRPSAVQSGWGICRVCSARDPGRAADAFTARMATMGATVLGAYVNAHTPVPAKCAAGHVVMARPHDVRKGYGICRICANQDPATAEAAFHARLAELGAVSLETSWTGSTTPHRIRCSAGHLGSPLPAGVAQGQGICRRCAGRMWDAFYVVSSATAVKFGVTSGNPQRRLKVHQKAGYSCVIRLLTGLPGETAPQLERAVAGALRLAKWVPVRGKEYFDIDSLAVILDIVDNYPLPTAHAKVA